MTSAVFEAKNYETLKPVIDFAKLHGVFVRSVNGVTKNVKIEKNTVEPFATEEEATKFATNISMRLFNEAW